MIVKFTKAVDDKDQLNYTVTIPKHIMARLVDCFVFNTEMNPCFDGRGQFEGVEGMPEEINTLIKTLLDIRMDSEDWRQLLRNELPSVFTEEVQKLIRVQEEEWNTKSDS